MHAANNKKCFVEECRITRPLLGRIVKEEDGTTRPVWVCYDHQWMTRPLPRPQRPGKEAS
jgi:hypothetical protein